MMMVEKMKAEESRGHVKVGKWIDIMD